MTNIKLLILALFAGNIFLLGLEASKAPQEVTKVSNMTRETDTGIPGIVLLREMGEPDAGTFGSQCFTVGPFESLETADAIVTMLSEYTSEVRPRETEAFVDRGYWVYLPPYEDEQGARQAIRILYGAGMDVALIKNGEFNNSVSLGYFISQSNARNQRDRVRDMGFQAEFRIQREDESRFWVDYRQQAGVEYASRVLADMVPAELHRSTACARTDDDLALRNTGSFN